MYLDTSRRRKIWIVDDSATDASRVQRLLALDYDVEVISDGAAALERLTSEPLPDLLLLDWVMPGISGIEVCHYIRLAHGKLPQLPILLLTARHGPEEITQAFASGANDYVAKPFVEEELKARVRALLVTKCLLERAEQAEADVRELLTSAPDAIFALDPNGIVSFVNDEGLHILNRTQDDVVGKEFARVIPGVNLLDGAEEISTPLPDVWIGEKVFSPSLRARPSQRSPTITVVLRDVTGRRRAETRRLDFYNIIAHDLRTPITSALLRLQLSLRGKHGELPLGLIGDIRQIDGSLRSLLGLINDFLELAKLEGIGYKIDPHPVDMVKLIQITIEDFRPLFEKNHLKWVAEGLEKPVIVLGDAQRLSQVVANLIGNAVKFTPPSGKITTSLKVMDSEIEFSVTDTGRGIAESEIPRLFERFTRAQDSENETGGTGLGLMIVREMIEAHGGTIGVESQLGTGSRFWFRIHRQPASANPSVASRYAAPNL